MRLHSMFARMFTKQSTARPARAVVPPAQTADEMYERLAAVEWNFYDRDSEPASPAPDRTPR